MFTRGIGKEKRKKVAYTDINFLNAQLSACTARAVSNKLVDSTAARTDGMEKRERAGCVSGVEKTEEEEEI